MMKQIPNYLTMFRMASVLGLYLTFHLPAPLGHWLAVVVFGLGAITDFFDGYLARKFDAQSDFGRMFDPIADKLMVLVCLVMLVSADIITPVHLPAAILIIAREVLVSGLREFLGARAITLPVSTLAKYKTAVQMVALICLLAGPSGDAALPGLLAAGFATLWLSALLTVITGYAYLKASLYHLRHAG
ncbi:MAG: CDP-diacylglycerol--glycerol-3-phosphate 3-phosphatidyltransferase [PS1 clade bacterium]|nr:CDP-diacylglycerol--glycerol-3-phosphate 3-phosphatidyltransferase [PS1 clade bacterium]